MATAAAANVDAGASAAARLTTATAERDGGGGGRSDGPGTETTPAGAAGPTAAVSDASSAAMAPSDRLAFYDGPAPGSPPKRSFTSRSRIPPECLGNVPCAVGVDEAGRGPVLGPMVYAICYCPVSRKEDLARLGFADSKVLKEEHRSSLFGVIKEHAYSYIGYATRSLVPQDISEAMLRRSKCNLNLIAHNATIELIRDALVSGLNISEIYVDTVGGPESYQAKLSATFPGMRVTVAKKADAKYPVVSAASIAAKVTRDEVLRNWIFEEDPRPQPGAEGPGGETASRAEASPAPAKFSTGFGSGYPSDPNTMAWLKSNVDPVFGYPSLIRFSWLTAERLLETSAVKVTWPDYEQVAEWGAARGGNVADMFAKSGDGARKVRQVFGDLGLKRVGQF